MLYHVKASFDPPVVAIKLVFWFIVTILIMSNQLNFQICPYRLDVVPIILKLLKKTLGEGTATRKTNDFWHWKHTVNPFGESYGLYAWHDEKRIAIGLRILMRWQFESPAGEIIHAVRAVDTATHPDFQRRGIFSALTRQALDNLKQEGVHLVFNTPNQYSLPGYLKLGWQVVAKLPMYIKIISPLSMMLKIMRLKPVAQQPIQFDKYFSSQILTWQEFAKKYQTAMSMVVSNSEQQRKHVGLRTPRNLAYLQWRYGEHPHLTYGVYPFKKEGELVGFAVLRPNIRYGLREIVLTDLFLDSHMSQLGNPFLKTMRNHLKSDYLIAHFSKGTYEQKILSSMRFLPIPRKPMIFTVNVLNASSHHVLCSENWDITLGDLEIF